jgi:hypothetical protein
MKLNIDESPVADGMALEMRATALGRNNTASVIRYPTTWLDAFKLRWFPGWLCRLFPANETIVTIDSCYVLEKCPWAVPDHLGKVKIVYNVREGV